MTENYGRIAIEASEVACIACTPFIPEGPVIAGLMSKGAGCDGKLIDGAGKWNEASDKYKEAKEKLEGLVRGVSAESWSGKDRDAFEKEMTQFGQQLDTNVIACETAAVTLGVLAGAMEIYAAFCVGMAVAVVADAAIVAAADATIIGAPEGEAEGASFGAACVGVMETANTVLMGAMTGGAAIFGVGMFVDAGFQSSEGDQDVLGDLVQAEITAAPETVEGILEGRSHAKESGEEPEGMGLPKVAYQSTELPGSPAGWVNKTGIPQDITKPLGEAAGDGIRPDDNVPENGYA
ncbi:PPE domain-containing protein [Actinomadura rupiterrae]|uniref:PPE domain-containing protein n=1 Tax=Actinomadura rupiterrae TaxID=559627 RepID=UPI0020A43ADF|nr:PPE domain-containing protein [Actinomadura rupiterrae]MCP2337142.1 uncharacterized protein YukE [Actinomadura rupiterrae]